MLPMNLDYDFFFTVFNNAIVYKLCKQYILVLIQLLLTSYLLVHSKYKLNYFIYMLYSVYICKNLVKLQHNHAFIFMAVLSILNMLSLGLYRHAPPPPPTPPLPCLFVGCFFFFISHALLLPDCNLAGPL